jgi:hypothetical protein
VVLSSGFWGGPPWRLWPHGDASPPRDGPYPNVVIFDVYVVNLALTASE